MILTFKELYTKANLNQSTASYQRDKFSEFIPCSGKGRGRRYNQESVDVLIVISEMYGENKTYEEIREALEQRFGVPAVIVHQDNSTTQQDVITAIKESFREEVKALEDKIDLLASDARDRDTQSQSRDAVLMDVLRAIREKNEKKWWRFWR